MTMTIVGGTVQHPKLTKKLESADPKEYAIGKMVFWNNLLRDGSEPAKWHAPNRNGTKVDYVAIRSALQASTALGAFKGYVDGINALYGMDFTVELELTDKDRGE